MQKLFFFSAFIVSIFSLNIFFIAIRALTARLLYLLPCPDFLFVVFGSDLPIDTLFNLCNTLEMTLNKAENVVPELEVLAPSNNPVLEPSGLGMNLIVQH